MIVIETDFEPDDAIFIEHFLRDKEGTDVAFVVGESKFVQKKMEMLMMFLVAIKFRDFVIIRGAASTKHYPVGVDIEPDTEFDAKIGYKALYLENEVELCIMLKPPREAMELMDDEKFRAVASKIPVLAYGSFNWRTLKKDKDAFVKFMGMYPSFTYVDSFTAIGEKNSNVYTGENKAIQDLIIRWNEHISAECEEDLKTETDEDSRKRSQKIIDNIASAPLQYVMADVCILLVNNTPVMPVSLGAMAPYPVWVEEKESKVWIMHPDFKEARREKLLSILNE